MSIPQLELEHYKKNYINDETALDDLCKVMQDIFSELGRETIKYCREYLTLIESEDIKDISYDILKEIIIHIYKTTFKEHSVWYESLKGLEYVLPSEYSLHNTTTRQLGWMYSNYKHYPISTQISSDSISSILAINKYRNKIENVVTKLH